MWGKIKLILETLINTCCATDTASAKTPFCGSTPALPQLYPINGGGAVFIEIAVPIKQSNCSHPKAWPIGLSGLKLRQIGALLAPGR